MHVTANGLSIAVERHGDPAADAVLLLRGLGSQVIHWPPALIAAFVESGRQVVAFDNRDSGLSDDGPAGGYSLRDMAADAVGVLDALGLAQAHGFGISMGGMILQAMALDHPERLCSATVVMSSSRAPGLPSAPPEILALLAERAPDGSRDAVIAHELRTGRAWYSPGWPFDPAERARLIGRAYDRAYRPDGTARQLAAIEAGAEVLADIERIATPTLVIHGAQDTLLPPAHGRDIAARIPGAVLTEIDGMGHDLEEGLARIVAARTLAFWDGLPAD